MKPKPTLTPADWGRIRNALKAAANLNHYLATLLEAGERVKALHRNEKAYLKTLEKVKGVGK